MIELGGNIRLVGFKDTDKSSLIVVKKLVGNHIKHLSDVLGEITSADITRKDIHNNKHECHVKISTPKASYSAECVEHNLYVALDKVMKKIRTEI
jgi:ribosome-associated translation inhibitor RaiA